MADIKDQLIKDSYNYVLQCNFGDGIVYRIGGAVPVNPVFQSGLTVNDSFTYSNGTEQLGYVLTCDSFGNAIWAPVTAATPSSGVTSVTGTDGIAVSPTTGNVVVSFTGTSDLANYFLSLSGGTVSGFTSFNSGVDINSLTAYTANFQNISVLGQTDLTTLQVTSTSIFNDDVSIYADLSVEGNIYATTISATTYLNYPDSYVTGFSLNNNIITLSQNRTDQYSAFTISLSAYTGSSLSGDYLPLSGGTVSGNTYFTSGLSANTLFVSGLTRTSGLTSTGGITFPQKTVSSTYTVTDFDYMVDVTGGTFNVQLPTAVGVQGRLLAIKNNGGGAVTILPFGSEKIDDKNLLILSETNAAQLVSNGAQWVILGQDRSTVNNSTGVFEFSGLSKVSSTQFSVARVKGWIVDDTSNPLSPQIYYVDYSGGTHTDIYVNTAFETFVYLTSGATIGQQATPLTEQQRRQNIFLGKIGHPEKTSINLVFSQPDFVLSPLAQLRDVFAPINLINGGVYPSVNTGLTFNTSAGFIYGLGINFSVNTLQPNAVTIPGQSPCTFQYRTQTGGSVTNVTQIDPTKWDDGGVVTPVSGVKSTNQRIYLLQNGQFRIQYGQEEYNQLSAAIAGIQTETFTVFPNFTNNAILIGILSITSTCDNLSDTSRAQIFLVSKFGETVGAAGGIGTTTLQQAYLNSSEPEITINSTLDGISIKNGTTSADTVAQLIQGISSGGTITSFIRADGAISGTTFLGNGGNLSHVFHSVNINGTPQFSANTNTFINFSGINLNIISGANNTLIFSAGTGGSSGSSGFDVYVTGGTYNGSEILFTNNSGGTFTVTGLTATGFSANYYGSFSDSTNQPVSGANIATVWKYNTTEISNGISVVDNTKITVQNTGVYEIGYSAQIEKTQGTEADVTIWAKINGQDVERSSSTLGLVANSVYQLPFVSYILELNAGDYVEFYFSSDSQYVQLTALSGLTTPTRPDSPSVIIVAKQVGLSTSIGGSGDTFVTGFSLNNDVITLSQNRKDQYSAFTISLSAYTGSSLSGDYLPLSGGTVTGGTQFTGGLTANTISATTYQNLPVSGLTEGNNISITGANGNFTISFTGTTGSNFTGGTVSGATIFTGGLSANTISATTYYNVPNYNAGVIVNSDLWINNNDGTMTFPTTQVALYNNAVFTGSVEVYVVTSATTGSGGLPALSNNDTNYIVINYNGGSPVYDVLTDNSTINDSNIVLYLIVYRANNFVHVLDFGNEGAGLPNKLNDRIIATDRFARESGFSLALSGSTGVVTLSGGIAWNATNRQSLVAVNSQDDVFFQSYHSGSTWVYTTTSNTLNNLYYDTSTDKVLATAGKYLVNWYFRGQEVNDHLYEVWSTDEYDTVSEAQLSTEPNLPELITSHAFLTGRIIVQVSATTGIVESAFVQVFQPTTVQSHNDLTGIQGGSAGQYYHLTSSEYANVAYKNVNNIFSVGQLFNDGITATTISATTYQNLPVSGLTGGDNISVTGSNGNFTISFTGTTGSNFTGGTVSGATIFTDGLTANTISATTYQNLPVSAITNGNGISVSSNNNGLITITNTQQQGITGITATDGLSGDTTSFLTTIINIDKGSSQNIFKNIQIGGITQFSANSNNSDLNFSGIGITITSAATNTLVFTNQITQGITGITSGDGITATTSDNNVTITNLGVTGITAGYGISASTSTGNVVIIQQFDYGKAYTTGNNLNYI